MKELIRFRQFLAEGQINENEVEQTRDIIVQRLQDELGHDEELDAMYQGYIPLVQQAKDMKELAMLIDKFGSEVYKVTGDGQWEEYIVKDTPLVDRKTFEIPRGLAEDRGEFGQESLDKLFDTVEAMGEGPVQQKAMDMMEDGAFFPEEGTSPAVNQTQEAVEELNYAKNTNDEETIEEAKLSLDAIILIKNAVKKTGPVSYGEMGQSYNYYVKGDDLFTQTRETFEVPTNEGEEVNEQELDIENPGNPLYDLNNDEEAVKYLNDLIDKYGETVVQLWITSGNYPQSY